MDSSLSHLTGSFSNAAFAYLILAGQLTLGFPPFYRGCRLLFFEGLDVSDERMVRRATPFLAGIMAMIVLSFATGLSVFYLAAGVTAACGGLWLRRNLYRTTGGTLPWMIHPWTVRWPMLVFDIWTLGIAALFGLMML